jgi:bacterioferritin-associated ferredoxin
VICICSGTTRGKVRLLFEEGLDAEAISRRTGALSGCGGCEWEIADMLKVFAELKKDA